MSVGYLKSILENGRNIVCLLGRGPSAEQGCDLYREDFSYDVEVLPGSVQVEIRKK